VQHSPTDLASQDKYDYLRLEGDAPCGIETGVVPRKADSNGREGHLRLFCKERMPFQLIPREIIVLGALPKNSSGKVLKRNLKTL
jgi:acyl-CoA synthetase (AMP-forming)/AMP-acid ligase II